MQSEHNEILTKRRADAGRHAYWRSHAYVSRGASGGELRTLARCLVALLEKDLQVPVVHASICQAWQIHKHLMVRETMPGYGRLLAELP